MHGKGVLPPVWHDREVKPKQAGVQGTGSALSALTRLPGRKTASTEERQDSRCLIRLVEDSKLYPENKRNP